MTTQTTPHWPHRLRLYGGRNTHATRAVPGGGGTTRLLTACGYTNGPRDERKPDDAPVTCRNCAREMNR